MSKHEFLNGMEEPFYIITTEPNSQGLRYYVEGMSPVVKSDIENGVIEAPEGFDLNEVGDDDWIGVSVEVGVGDGDIHVFSSLEEGAFVLKNLLETFESGDMPGFDTVATDSGEFPFYVEQIKPTLTLSRVDDSDLLIADLMNGLPYTPLDEVDDEDDY